jgi:hypothetical protein
MTDKLSLPALPEGYRWNLTRGRDPERKLKLLRIEEKSIKFQKTRIKLGFWANLIEPYRSREWPSTREPVEVWNYVASTLVWPLDPEKVEHKVWEGEINRRAQIIFDKLMKDLDDESKLRSLAIAVEEANDA